MNVVCTCYYIIPITIPMAKWDLLYRDLLYEKVSSKDFLFVAETDKKRLTLLFIYGRFSANKL